jgi:hypothetical protein
MRLLYALWHAYVTNHYTNKMKNARLTWALKNDFGLNIRGCFERIRLTADHAFAPSSQTACARIRASMLLRVCVSEAGCDLRDDLELIAVEGTISRSREMVL